jgi:hypothetical protein
VAARWAASLSSDGEDLCLSHHSDRYPDGPHPDQAGIALEVGTLYGELHSWTPAHPILHIGAVVPAERSELVRLLLSHKRKSISWLQRAPADPPFGEDRDRAAFVRLLGAKGFLRWLASLLADDERQTGGDWTNDDHNNRSDCRKAPVSDGSLPTLEEMLAAWGRNTNRFNEIERRVALYLPSVLEQADQEDPETADMLRRFDDLWKMVCSGLRVTRQRRKNQ